ncbi:Flagellar basal-body rod protein FlgG [Planctomycetes bacterium Pan216]|uniref:Flagellar basal-body rod protein FlgG n=1 Tax=Kolteria novifilia TaxID=2527975 RepID=A0A518AXT1_9BACT|nr:Flagellar basal-body rod protein FlgG [Planctomycetes bacterium Pan216]
MSLQALNTGATGMIGQSLNLDVIANNLANTGTTGFKRSRANFEDLLYKTLQIPGAGPIGDPRTPGLGLQFGVGTRVSSTQLDFIEGTLQQTDRALDVAINGVGFIAVDDGQGNLFYTRAGNLTLNDQGQVVMATAAQGYVVQPPIQIPPDALSIAVSADGVVSITQPNVVQPVQVGQLDAFRFQNPEGLQQIGNNLFQESGSSGNAEQGQWNQNGYGSLIQNFLEQSNVEPVNELINLISSQRTFELNSQVVQTANENLQTVGALRQ